MLQEQLEQIKKAIEDVDFDLAGIEEEVKKLKSRRAILVRTEKQIEKSVSALDELGAVGQEVPEPMDE